MQSVELIERVYHEAPFGAVVFGDDGEIVYANPKFCETINQDYDRILGKSIFDGVPKLLLDENFSRQVRELIETGKKISFTIETYSTPRIRESGWYNIFGYRVEQLFILIIEQIGGFAHDTRYRNLILDAPDIIVVLRYGAITFCNKAFCKILELDVDQILGHQLWEFFQTSQEEPMQVLTHENIKEFSAQITAMTSLGHRIFDGKFHSIDENPGMSLAVLRDVTEKIQLEKKLVRQNLDLKSINLISATLSSSFDLDEILQATVSKVLEVMNIEVGWIFLMNENDNTLRCTYASGLPTYVVETIKELHMGEGIAGRVAETGKAIIIENASEDIRIRSVAFRRQGIKSFASIPLKSRTRLIGVMNVGSYGQRDITTDDERLLVSIGLHMGSVIENILLFNKVFTTSEELKGALATIEQRNEELKGLIYTVSHDLKNPIIAVNGFSNRLLKSANEHLAEKEREYLHAIQESGKHMETFVTNLLTLSAAENQKIEEEEFSVQEILEHITVEVAPQLEEKNGTIDVEIEMPKIITDKTRIMQIFSNLISNSIKYSNPKRELQICIGYKSRSGMHVFSVRDNGIGIPPEYLDSVFDDFFRAYENIASGTGLGLSIVKKAVNVLGGDIWVDSKKDEGSIFYFSIPHKK